MTEVYGHSLPHVLNTLESGIIIRTFVRRVHLCNMHDYPHTDVLLTYINKVPKENELYCCGQVW